MKRCQSKGRVVSQEIVLILALAIAGNFVARFVVAAESDSSSRQRNDSYIGYESDEMRSAKDELEDQLGSSKKLATNTSPAAEGKSREGREFGVSQSKQTILKMCFRMAVPLCW